VSFLEIRKLMSQGKSKPFELEKIFISNLAEPLDITDNPRQFMAILINLSAGENDYFSEEKAATHLKNQKYIHKIIHALRGLHTHNIKIPNTNRNGQIYYSPSPTADKAAGVYSATLTAQKQLGWAANAAESKSKLFFATEFYYSGKVTCLFQEFLEQTSELVVLIKALGLSDDNKQQLHEACQKVVAQPLPIHAEDPQILWPVDNSHQNYYALTPVPHVATLREIRRRTAPVEADNHWFDTERVLIGGTKPINAGDFICSMAGWLKLLKSNVPKQNHHTLIKLCNRIGSRKTALNIDSLTTQHFSFMNCFKLTNDNKPWMTSNLEHQAQQSINEFIDVIFESFNILREAILNKSIDSRAWSWAQKRLPKIEIIYLTQELVDTNHEKQFIEYLISKLAYKIQEVSDTEEDMHWTSHLKDILQHSLRAYVGQSDE
jgi:hypothetical protein